MVPGKFVKVGKLTDIPEGKAAVVVADGKRIALCRYNGQFYAIDDRCTHDNGPLGEGQLLRPGELECPRHGARFDIKTGRALCLPATGSVATYAVEVRGEEIWLEVQDHV